jgi:oligoendopeptidase F
LIYLKGITLLKLNYLNKKNLAYYERNVPIGDVKDEYSIEDAFKIVSKVFKNLDLEFESYIKTYIKEGRYDVYPNKGKESGAFCIALGDRYPIYMLLNFEKRLKDILTISHESGHALHAQYSFTQSPLNQGHSTACAEVASTFFEDFTLEEISKSIPEEQKSLLLLKSLDEDISSIFRQIACYNFELSLHTNYIEKGFLSK